jgi:aspartate/glutamate racemase
MESLKIEKTKTTPSIEFDTKFHTLSIRGDVYPENTEKFFNPIFDWLNRYLSSLHHKCIVSFHLQYFNTASSGKISQLLELLEKAYKKGKDISIHWYYEPDNDEMEEVAEEFREGITIPFQIIEKKL